MTLEVLVVGAGISGIGVGIEMMKRGKRDFLLLERAADLGGTWRDNRYPGVAVDIPSASYCFSFETDFRWTRAYAGGAEILEYVRQVAGKYGIEEHIRYGANVESSRFDEERELWVTTLDSGEELTSRVLIAATGLFATPVRPDIEGLDDFEGHTCHSARWREDLPVDGRVGIIGTGASAVQIVPELTPRSTALSVFQRTPIYVAPKLDYPLWQGLLSPRRSAFWRRLMRGGSEAGIELLTWGISVYARLPFLVNLVEWADRKWMGWQVRDPETRAKLMPSYRLGCKRPAPSNGYLRSFNEAHVDLVTEPIERVESGGIRTADGRLHELDTLVLATGFLTTQKGNIPAFEVVGRKGLELGQFWEDERLQAYEGVAVPGFPNFFLTAGPYSGGFNWFAMLEAHLEVIFSCLEESWARENASVEVRPEAHAAYMEQMWTAADGTVFKHSGCAGSRSYYIDRHGDASLPLPLTPWWRVRAFRKAGLEGFVFGD